MGLLVGLLVLTLGLVGAAPVAGAEYTMVTRATYTLADTTAEAVEVAVDIAFTNTFAAPAGQVSVFREIKLAIHDHAAAVSASDASGALSIAVAVAAGVNVATIQLRAPLGYGKTANLALAYELRDGDDPAIRVGSHLVTFPAWGFGTASRVTVDLPSEYEVRIDGDPMVVDTADGRTILDSGAITNPPRWLAHVGATRQPAYETEQRTVALSGATVEIQVRHWTDDPEWGVATADLLVEALPLLEEAFGIPYPGVSPLVVVESVTGGGPDQAGDGTDLAVGFTEPPFTVLHQAAHVWAGDELVADRWLAEGLASWAAAATAAELDLEPPHDPAAVAEQLKAEAFPLAEWTAEERSADAEAWAMARSWELMGTTAGQMGDESFQEALQRMASGLDGYDPLGSGDLPTGIAGPAVDTRAFLDHLDAVTEAPVVEALAGPALGEGAAAELAARTEARAARDALLVAAGDWGDPDPVRAAMVEWRFADAQAEIASATEWLAERDALLAEIEDAGLQAPDRLAAAYRTHGGAEPAWAEIAAERAVVDAYVVGVEEVEALDPLARVGLLIGPSPEERLDQAADAFASGDLRAAADLLASLHDDLESATAAGLLRLVGLGVALAAGAILLVTALRRRRPTDYTPQP